MGKLVRDKIPQIIIADGRTPIVRTLSDEEYLSELDRKLNEEVAEYQAEEIADVLEVLLAICEARGHSVDELIEVRDKKREKRGGFRDKVYWEGNE